jgi:hypothetical protein
MSHVKILRRSIQIFGVPEDIIVQPLEYEWLQPAPPDSFVHVLITTVASSLKHVPGSLPRVELPGCILPVGADTLSPRTKAVRAQSLDVLEGFAMGLGPLIGLNVVEEFYASFLDDPLSHLGLVSRPCRHGGSQFLQLRRGELL